MSRKRLLHILSEFVALSSFAIAVLINLDIFYLLFIFLYSFRCICLPLGEYIKLIITAQLAALRKLFQ